MDLFFKVDRHHFMGQIFQNMGHLASRRMIATVLTSYSRNIP